MTGMVKLALPAGKANPAPPVGPALGAKVGFAALATPVCHLRLIVVMMAVVSIAVRWTPGSRPCTSTRWLWELCGAALAEPAFQLALTC